MSPILVCRAHRSVCLFFFVLSIALAPSVVHAQAIPRGEFAIGFPFLSGDNSSQLFGIDLSGGANVNRWLGFSAQADSHFGEALYEGNLHTVVAGPVVSSWSARSRVFGRASFGIANSKFGNPRTVFASAFGGGADLGSRLALHLTLDILTTHFDSDSQNFVRMAVGVRFPIGTM